jgi:hypothetical protein
VSGVGLDHYRRAEFWQASRTSNNESNTSR